MKKKSGVIRQTAVVLGIETAAFAVGVLLRPVMQNPGLASMIFILGVFFVAVFTEGYAYGIAASLISTLIVNWAFTYPAVALNFAVSDNLLSDVCMLSVSVVTSTQTVKLKRQKRLEAENELERSRANLLRAVSHDLRTPLTSVYGNCSAVLENYDRLSREQHLQFLGQACQDAQWLIRMVENLLAVTRMNVDGDMRLRKTPVVLEELAQETAEKFLRHYPQAPLQVQTPERFVRVPMDGMLIGQVCSNLLENAARHGKGLSRILFQLQTEDGKAWFTVEDDGCGIPPERMKRLFSDFIQGQDEGAGDQKRGMGIGLSVCATIVRAHGGEIYAENVPEGGARFRFYIPAGEEDEEEYEQ